MLAVKSRCRNPYYQLLAVLALAIAAFACIDFYEKIACDTDLDCPFGYKCAPPYCEGGGQTCQNDSDCDVHEAEQNHRELLCVRMPWESEHSCRMSCSPGTTGYETSCLPGQECRALSDGTSLGACF